MKIFYKTAATATGGRSGTSTLNDGSFSVQMVRPDSDEDGVNPEQLFALGYAACFDSAMEITAKQLKLNAKGAKLRLKWVSANDPVVDTGLTSTSLLTC